MEIRNLKCYTNLLLLSTISKKKFSKLCYILVNKWDFDYQINYSNCKIKSNNWNNKDDAYWTTILKVSWITISIQSATFFRMKKKAEQLKLKRLHHIASIGFVDQHPDWIDNIKLCLKLMWENYNKEDPSKKLQMLKDIIFL